MFKSIFHWKSVDIFSHFMGTYILFRLSSLSFKVQAINNRKCMLQIFLSSFFVCCMLQTTRAPFCHIRRRVEFFNSGTFDWNRTFGWERVNTMKQLLQKFNTYSWNEKEKNKKKTFHLLGKRNRKGLNGKNVKYLYFGVCWYVFEWNFSLFFFPMYFRCVGKNERNGMCKESNKACSWHKGQFVSYCASITRHRECTP